MTAWKPLVSVILPVFNGERFLLEAAASIQQQGYSPMELIIVDDGSTDGTALLVSELGQNVRYLFQANAGPAAARNTGIQAASGEVIAFIDVDDLWPPDKLQCQLSYLERDSSLEVVLGRIQYDLLTDDVIPNVRFEGDDQTFVNVHLGSGLFRREVFEHVGLFDVEMRYSEDADWLLRALEADISILIARAVTLRYRQHEANMTRNRLLTRHYFFRALKRSIERRRQPDGTIRSIPNLMEFDEEQLAITPRTVSEQNK